MYKTKKYLIAKNRTRNEGNEPYGWVHKYPRSFQAHGYRFIIRKWLCHAFQFD